MKFRFAGNLDVPDWLLAEIAVLAPLSTNTCNILCNVVVQQIKTSTLNYKEIEQLTTNPKNTQIRQTIPKVPGGGLVKNLASAPP